MTNAGEARSNPHTDPPLEAPGLPDEEDVSAAKAREQLESDPEAVPNATDPESEEEPAVENRMAAHIKAVQVEHARLDADAFRAWAVDYCERKHGLGFGLSELKDLFTLGAEGAIAKWSL